MDEKKSLSKYYDGRGHFGKSLANIRDYSNDLLIELANQENRSLSNLKKRNFNQINFFKFWRLSKANFQKVL